MNNSKRLRQYAGIIAATVAYFIVHEGAHLLVAAVLGLGNVIIVAKYLWPLYAKSFATQQTSQKR